MMGANNLMITVTSGCHNTTLINSSAQMSQAKTLQRKQLKNNVENKTNFVETS